MSRARNELGKNIVHRRIELAPTGVDGSAVATYVLRTGPAVVRFIGIDYQNQPATTDIVISTAVDGAAGTALFTVTSANTDIPLKPVSLTAGVDEAGAALAATDGSAGGFPVKDGIYIDVAQADGQTSGDEKIVVDVIYELCEYVLVTAIATSGADGAAVFTGTGYTRDRGAGVIRAVKVDYQNMPVTTDILVKADDTNGATLLTLTSSNTDVALSPVGMPGLNESNAALAATDASDGGFPFKKGIFVDVAEADAFTSGNEKIVIEFWCDT